MPQYKSNQIRSNNRPKLEAAMYEEAHRANLTFSEWLEYKATTESHGDSNFSGWFNPDLRDERGKKLDAYEQALLAYGIRVSGPTAQTGDAFFHTPDSRVLFPEYIERTWRYAQSEATNELRVADLVAATVTINSGAYTGEYLDEDQIVPLLPVEQGEPIPQVVVKHHTQSIRLQKYGVVLAMTYEAIRRSQLPLLTAFIQKVALDTRRAQARQAVLTLVNGDGNSNPAPNTAVASPGLWTLGDIIDLMLDFTDSYEPNLLVADEDTVLRQLLKMDLYTGSDTTAEGGNFRDTGSFPSPLGMTLKYIRDVPEMAEPEKLLAVDTRFALVEVREENAQLTETDRLIQTQFERVALSEVLGFSKLMTAASRTKTNPS